MKKEPSKVAKLLNKLAAKRFSKNERIVLLIIFLVLMAACYFYLNIWIDKRKEAIKIVAPLAPPAPKDRLKKKRKQVKPPNIKKRDEKKIKIRDQFLSSINVENPEPNIKIIPKANLKLKGILWDEQIPSAIINSKVVKIGDLIFDKTIVDIEKDKVVLMEEGKIYILHLKKK